MRGTDFVVLVGDDGSTQVGVLDGAVEMAALDASDAIVIPAGNSAEVGAGAATVTTGIVVQVRDAALGVSGPIGQEDENETERTDVAPPPDQTGGPPTRWRSRRPGCGHRNVQ